MNNTILKLITVTINEQLLKIEIKYSVKIIENNNKIHCFDNVGIEIFYLYFNYIEFY